MRALFVLTLLVVLVLPSGHASGSPPSDISAEELQTFGEIAASQPRDLSAEELQTLHTQAAQGDAMAQFKLGELHLFGRGVHQDYVQAAKWYEKAAVQGNAGAQNDLGTLYATGGGVPQDDVRAYMWVSLAVAHSTGKPKKYAAINLGFLTHRMTPAQLAEAQRLSQQCQTQQFKGC